MEREVESGEGKWRGRWIGEGGGVEWRGRWRVEKRVERDMVAGGGLEWCSVEDMGDNKLCYLINMKDLLQYTWIEYCARIIVDIMQ